MNKEEFRNYFWNMPAMKYYEPDLNKPKAQDMIKNQDGAYLAMQKFDGEWNMAIILEDEVLMRGRNLTVSGDYKNRANMLPQIVRELRALYPSGTVLLGELAFPDATKTSKDVGTIMRCLPAKAIQRQETNPLSFFIFDCLAYDWEDIHIKPFSERIKYKYVAPWIFNMVQKEIKYIVHPNVYNGSFMEVADMVWANGGEGLVIIKSDEPYRPGERKAWTSLKLKKKLDNMKLKVIDFIEPNKNYEGKEIETWQYFIIEKDMNFPNGMWGYYEKSEDRKSIRSPEFRTIAVTKPYFYGWKNGVVVEHNGNRISVTSGLTDQAREWLATPEAASALKKGELFAIITGMEITQGSIRHPVFISIEN